MIKPNSSEYNLSQKNIHCPFLLCVGVYKPTPYALLSNTEILMLRESKKSKYYLGTTMLKKMALNIVW